MATKKKKKSLTGNMVAQNRKARHNYSIDKTFEAGIILQGSEVKSLRGGHCSLGESYATEKNGELYLVNAHISEYAPAKTFQHEPKAARKLLLKKGEINQLLGAVNRKGMALVPLSIYFNDRGIAKVELALAHGKQKADKRAYVKDREWQRDKARVLKVHNQS
ncbi:MAG: SsrA-binding protein SmpB [Rhodospirillales bacterium]|jgi:SsrA-binding protein|nr:SsrA-binding protein SmpB [Rhodospirillales bacterium]MBT4041686.1 SsrA-binding protein SmpB [Rhodospirillales bacterium]MBT4626390.1 SsrA-binding protein SmpB [Rhodospirillales bacterium]MBT5350122.1 SsrA-binding protein SmpB [Rhodospirillales bacterium]MBT5520364.1 SsrA-binding protein SmpB [Rhodospirillales bacterium]